MKNKKKINNDFFSYFIQQLQTKDISYEFNHNLFFEKYQILDKKENSLPCVMYLLDYKREKFIYLSSEIYDLIGYTSNNLIENSYQLYLDYFHAEDKSEFKGPIFENLISYIKSQPKKTIKKNQFSINYRIHNKHGEYVKILDQFIILEVDGDKNPLFIFGMLSDISNHKSDNKMILTINQLNTELCNKARTQVTKVFSKKPTFTVRQKQIIDLIKNGSSSKEIAVKLDLSIHTVNAHRRKLLDKFDCKNTSELLNLYHSEL
ncbi:MAG: PAS domain-containing protein [Bacteroidia bacterium]|nr:PAS domain-containing protein [Bacteroidia bacterium]